MYLKEIKANNFKSFAEPITIELTNGISGIVGPNGSGKSNVVDAVRWVLGEQSVKSLRGEGTMSDVIFSGSKSRKAANFASVTLVFDNTDKYLNIEYEEVEIKRTIYKSGENEYFINNEKCRLKDILDLFMDTGASKESFNIISQGDVANILSGKAEDRRGIFEEAAGVLKYKKRKDEALRKLTKTHDNMTRVNDIIEELNNTLEPLKKQSEVAKVYLEKKEKLKNNEIALSVNDIEKYNFEYQFSKEKVQTLTDEIAKMLSLNSSKQAIIEKIKNNIENLNNDLYKKQQELVKVTSDVERLQGEKNLISERSKYNANDVKVHDNILLLKEKLLGINNEISTLEIEIENENTNNKDIADKLNNIINDLKKLEKEKENLVSELNTNIHNITTLKHRRDVLIDSIENNSSLPYSVKHVLNNPKLNGIYNVVGKVIEFEEKYSDALEVALLSASSHIICENENNAKDAINYLKDNKLGRATFLPISVMKERNIDSESYNIIKNEKGFVDIASNLVNFDIKYKNVILNLLGNIIVVENIDSANNIAKKINNRYRVVTLLGEVVNIGGSITGGSLKKSNILSEKYELENILKQIEVTNDNIKELENKINEIDENYTNIEYEKKSILINVETNSSVLNNKKENLEELILSKNHLELELNNNLNIVNNVISNEEEKVLDEYYSAKENQDKLNIEIKQTLRQIEVQKEELLSNESLLKDENSEYSKMQEELKSHEIKISRLDVKLDNLLNILNEEYSITYEKAKEQYILDIPEDDARSLVTTLKREIKALGDVNVSSIEEEKKVSERFEFLTKQKEDLGKAEDMLLEIINEMDEVMRVNFTETFEKIKEAFTDTFKTLFGGGSAELRLTDPSDVLTTGIDIVALPPGKKLQHISLLSGGEKTLTAISLLFAILRVRPVPFCILDEVEAALDEVNVDNFGKYLKKYKGNTQFILITHKKKTMEYADILYGITMQESGVSKLVSVKLEELKD
ncbi:MAG: AAA family ATPase [Bacilli bacterium]|nr:AAA family ATPase [Bacilli bacterium]MBO6194892.1 AAA family ATPase [Bacilli bacterium]